MFSLRDFVCVVVFYYNERCLFLSSNSMCTHLSHVSWGRAAVQSIFVPWKVLAIPTVSNRTFHDQKSDAVHVHSFYSAKKKKQLFKHDGQHKRRSLMLIKWHDVDGKFLLPNQANAWIANWLNHLNHDLLLKCWMYLECEFGVFPSSRVASYCLCETSMQSITLQNRIIIVNANRLISDQLFSFTLSIGARTLFAHWYISFCFPFYLNWLLCQHCKNSIFSFTFDVLLFFLLTIWAALLNHNIL